ncbi:hypothetical protein [Halolamina sp. C58]|uniref:hypothetical protein n=1 Tax=Halolamina sp. C58 TaxID=3421640 RepID=UPI003EB9B143
MSDKSRRRVLEVGGTVLLSGLAGCSGVTDRIPGGSTDTESPTATEDENTQQYTLPPVAELQGDGVPDDGTVTLSALFVPATTPGDPNLYFEDEITYELFVYDKFPVGNSVTLTKVAEKTNAPYEQVNETFELSYEDLPKNRQMRFRLKVTNNNTGESEWAMDERVFYYEQYGDIETAVTDTSYNVFRGSSDWTRNDFVSGLKENSYIMNFSGRNDISAPDLPEEVPFSREAYKLDNDLYRNNDKPISAPFHGSQIELPESHIDLSNELMQDYDVGSYYNSFTFTGNVPSEYDYYGRNQYDVLNNPIYTEMADFIVEAQTSYGIENHFGRIDKAAGLIQSQEYAAITGSIRDAPVHLPEAYWQDPAENCVGMSFQLCWLLYHLGYTCGTVWLDRSGRNASHLGVGIPVPEDVIESESPDGYLSTLEDPESPSFQFIEQISDNVGPDSRPETLGEYPWLYIEATSSNNLGLIPFDSDTIDNRRVRFAIEPEDNVFGTDVGAPNNR